MLRPFKLMVIPWLGVFAGCAGLQNGAGGPISSRDGDADRDAETVVALPAGVVIDELRVKGPEVPEPLERPLPAAPYASAWDRMRSGFRLPDHEDQRIERHRDYFADRPDYFRRVSQRAAPWLHYILEAIQARDMPAEVALVPFVESAFRPFAYSHSRASGMWQIVPVTARHMGLERNWWYDGRRDVIAATDAALDYLQRLEERFNGDWLLALAAYNAGEGTVLRAVRRNRSADKPTDFWHLDLPTETERYVPRILALRDLISDPGAHGIAQLPEIRNEPGVAIVEMEHQLDLANAADMAGISMKRLYQLNPGLNRWATPPDGPHRLVIPADSETRFRKELAATQPDERMHWRRHEVSRGETLSGIARDYNTRIDLLRDANDINGSTIRVGQNLIVPVASQPAADYELSATQRLQSGDSGDERSRRRYTVERGDSFWTIARRYGVGVRELASWNDMSPRDTLQPGDELVVRSTRAATQPRDNAQGTTTKTQQSAPKSTAYEVQKGDSLWSIARRHGVGVKELAGWNDIAPGETLRPGDQLTVKHPPDSDETLASADAPGEPGADGNVGARERAYVVEEGDNMWYIARKFDVRVRDLAAWNDLSTNATLQPGQELIVRSGARDPDSTDNSAEGPSQGDGEAVSYTVREGDSLYKIAREFGVSVDELRQWNSIRSDSYLQPGQTLRMELNRASDS